MIQLSQYLRLLYNLQTLYVPMYCIFNSCLFFRVACSYHCHMKCITDAPKGCPVPPQCRKCDFNENSLLIKAIRLPVLAKNP